MAITMGKSFAVFPIDVPGAVEAYAVDGSPADTVMLGLNAPIWSFDDDGGGGGGGEEGGGGGGAEVGKNGGGSGGNDVEEEKAAAEDGGSGGYSRSLRRRTSGGGGSGTRRTLKHAASFSAAVEEALGDLTLKSRAADDDGSVDAVEGAAASAVASAAAAAAAAAAATAASSSSSSSSSSFFYPHSRFDLVASGTNKGDNLGFHAWYSGTVGAAREGALSALPSLAFSLDDHGAKLAEDFDYASEFAAAIVSAVLQLGARHRRALMGHVLNVNFPRKKKCLRLFEEEAQGEGGGEKKQEERGAPDGGKKNEDGSSHPPDRMRAIALTTQGGHCWRPGFDERYARVDGKGEAAADKGGSGRGGHEERGPNGNDDEESSVVSPRAAAVAGDKASEPTTRYFKNIGGGMWEDRETAGTDSWAVARGMASVVVLGLKQHALTRGERAHLRELEEGERATEAGKEVVEVAAKALGCRAVLLP